MSFRQVSLPAKAQQVPWSSSRWASMASQRKKYKLAQLIG